MAEQQRHPGFRNNDIEKNRKITQEDSNRADIFQRPQPPAPHGSKARDGAHTDSEAPSDARPGADKQR